MATAADLKRLRENPAKHRALTDGKVLYKNLAKPLRIDREGYSLVTEDCEVLSRVDLHF